MLSKQYLSVLTLISFFAFDASAATNLGCLLRGDCFKGKEVITHLEALQNVAEKHGEGNRAAGSLGHEFSANYIAQQLLKNGYDVKLEPFEFLKYEKISAKFSHGSVSYKEWEEFNVMVYSPSTTVTAGVTAVDIQLGADNTSTSGCEASDFTDFPAGNIALIQRGTCGYFDKLVNAQAAGASAIVMFSQGNTPAREKILGGGLPEDGSIKIPALSISYQFGVELLKEEALELSIDLHTKIERKVSFNVIAETKGGNPDNIVMVGAHLDSVGEGPGINDNGSGSAAILAVALKIKDMEFPNKIRFAWFSAEELGLIGSWKYALALSPEEREKISLMINIDMIGSPNYKIGVYDGNGSQFSTKGPEGSATLEQLFHSFYASQGVTSVEVPLDGRSDYAIFSAFGIPVGGIFTGAEGIKTEAEAKLFGGIAGEAYDVCYHKACDDLTNINAEALEINTNAIASVIQNVAFSTAKIRTQSSNKGMAKKRVPVVFPKHLHCQGDEHGE